MTGEKSRKHFSCARLQTDTLRRRLLQGWRHASKALGAVVVDGRHTIARRRQDQQEQPPVDFFLVLARRRKLVPSGRTVAAGLSKSQKQLSTARQA